MRRIKVYKIFKFILFSIIFIIIFALLQNITIGFSGVGAQQFAGFLEEPRGSLDAVYIGASPVFTSWIAPIAWKRYNLAVRTLANDSQPFVAVESFLRTARKTQPDAVYLIAINGFYQADQLPVAALHSSTDYFPYSMDRIKLTAQLCRDFHSTPEESIELFFPLTRYHARWSSLQTTTFHRYIEPYKGSVCYSDFLNGIEDISMYKTAVQESKDLPSFMQNSLIHLLDYCKEEGIEVVFVLSAQYRVDTNDFKIYNTIMKEIGNYGFPLINELEDFGLIGLDDTSDFYNAYHTNIHGALKITDYLSKYLLDHYDFPEKSGEGYESWDEAYDKYKEIITPYLTEEELAQLP